MNLTQLCERIGLTEETIRYYREMKLITMELSNRDEEFYDYSDQEVQELQAVIVLRKALFSMEDILNMRNYPYNISAILKRWQVQLQSGTAKEKTLAEGLSATDIYNIDSITALAKHLRLAASQLPLPKQDLEPYVKPEPVPKSEKELLVEQFQDKQERQIQLGRRWMNLFIVFYSLGTFSNFISFLSETGQFFDAFILTGIRIAMTIALYKGVNWVWYLYCALGTIAVFRELYILLQLPFSMPNSSEGMLFVGSILFGVLLLIDFIVLTISILGFLFHKGVRDFLYIQRNG